MMAARQVIIVREAQDLKDKEYEGMENMFAKPWKHAVIVFCYKHGKPDMRRKAFKNLTANGTSFESAKLYDYQVEAWIKDYAREEGLKLEDEAVMLLSENCGANRSMIHNELSKLRIHLAKSSDKISAAMIEEYIGISREYTVFEFTKAFGAKDVSKAFRIARYFSRNEKEMPLVVFNAQLYTYFQKVHLSLLFKRLGDAELATQLGVPFYFVKDYRQAAQGLSSPKMGELFQLLAEYDARSKGMGQGGKSDGELILELCFRMFHVSGLI
jgi:DNA polymerase-3 subunit delta